MAPGSRTSAKILATSRPPISMTASAASALSHSMVSICSAAQHGQTSLALAAGAELRQPAPPARADRNWLEKAQQPGPRMGSSPASLKLTFHLDHPVGANHERATTSSAQK